MNLPARLLPRAARSAAALALAFGTACGVAIITTAPAHATPATPLNPLNPAKPLNPLNPASPLTPASPANPLNPVSPQNPRDPISPRNPVSPLSPISPANPANPIGLTSGYGWLRLAHLSPNTPAVDVYLYAVGDQVAEIVLRHVAYGTESPYERVQSGDYTVAMRAAGAPPSSKPVLSTLVDVAAGHAYTVAGMGPYDALRLQVLQDRLTAPPGKALVRIIQASLQHKRVSVLLGGKTLERQVQFGTASPYLQVNPGSTTLRIVDGSAHASSRLSLPAGSIHTLVVLDDPGHLAIQVLEDAAGSSTVPAGPADTGFGGTAAQPGPPLLPWSIAAMLGLVLAVASIVAMRTRHTAAHARVR